MNKTPLYLIVLSLLVAMSAAGQWNASSRVLLPHNVAVQAPNEVHSARYQAFVSLDDTAAIASLRQLGVTVNGRFGPIATVSIPLEALEQVSSIPGIGRLSLEQPVYLCNDSARFCSNIDPLAEGRDLIVPLTGEGVLVGIIDTGIDFNHINLCGSDGKTRVRAVYLPTDSTGNQPIVNGDTLPGSCFETPELIAMLTADNTRTSHGTHTAGTAAGSYAANGWHGVAPGADIVACGMPPDELTDVNIANAVNYIFDYADRMHRPCVINMSFGSNSGPNDGTSFLCKTYEALAGPGRICVVSAGNDGDVPVCFRQSLTGVGDTVTTLLRNQYGGLQRQGYVSMWSDGPQEHFSRIVIINRQTGEMEYASPVVGLLPQDSVFTISSDEDSGFAAYYDGEIQFANALEPVERLDGGLRYHSYWSFDATSHVAGHLLGIQYMAAERVDLVGWCTKNTYFYTFGLDGMTGGDPCGSISDLATTDSVISVGAYCSRRAYVDKEGNPYTFSRSIPGQIAYFSSYGPDECSVTRPDVCAPGLALMSSASRFDQQSGRDRWPASAFVDGIEYPYYSNIGTSMSAPVVAGTIALMLQVNPQLSAAEVRNILRRTSLQDDDVMAGFPEQWGFGKLDAAAAVADMLDNSLKAGDVNHDGEVNIADIMAIVDIVLTGTEGRDAALLLRADVNRDKAVHIADINRVINLIFKH